MRILFFISHPGHARNFEWVLREFGLRGHAVTIALDRTRKSTRPELDTGLRSIVEEYSSLGVEIAPSHGEWAATGVRVRQALDYLRFLEPPLATASKLRERAAGRAPSGVRFAVERGPLATPQARVTLERLLRIADRGVPRSKAMLRYIAEHRPDTVLVTPLVELGSPQFEYVRCAQTLGTPAALLVASWDNLTNKGRIYDAPELVIVWNEAQRREAIELHAVPPERVLATGAVPYDHWFESRPGIDRDAFMRRVGLDPKRPFFLYACSSRFIARDEARFLIKWARAVRRAEALQEAQILIRPHPTNPFATKSGRAESLADIEGLAVFPHGGADPTTSATRRDYHDSIFHSAGVVGLNTSALIEGAIVGRLVHTVLVSDFEGGQQGTLHFRYLLPENGGMLYVAADLPGHTKQLVRTLTAWEANAAERRAAERNGPFLESFVRPLGIDRPATPVLVDAIEGLAGETGTLSEDPMARRLFGRALAGAARASVDRLVPPRRGPDPGAATPSRERDGADLTAKDLGEGAAR